MTRSSAALLLLVLLTRPLGAQPLAAQAEAEVNALIDSLYASISFDPGEDPDWDRARSFFLPEAVLVFAPRGPGSVRVMDVDGWVQDFADFYEERDIATTGFGETIAGREVTVWGNIAHAFVVFEPRIGTDPESPTVPGLDSIELVRHDGRWWVAAITSQHASAELPIPERFRGG